MIVDFIVSILALLGVFYLLTEAVKSFEPTFHPINRWTKFSDTLPTYQTGEQVDILFGSPHWGTYLRGTYTHFPLDKLRDNLMVYNQQKDKYEDWKHEPPTHWVALPPNPQ